MLEALSVTGSISYLLGSIPFGLILLLLVRGVDVRRTGSGNIGAVNVGRISPGLGVLTLGLDVAKGFAGVALTALILAHFRSIDKVATHIVLGASALCAVVGHVFSVWLRFHGGKGVATAMGACLALVPHTVAAALVIYAIVLGTFRYASLASISAALVVPVFAYFLKESDVTLLLPFLCAVCFLTILRHHENIHRLLSGTEPRLFER